MSEWERAVAIAARAPGGPRASETTHTQTSKWERALAKGKRKRLGNASASHGGSNVKKQRRVKRGVN